MDKVVLTGVLVINEALQVLLIKKNSDGPYAGTYVMPGGDIEFGERIDAALQRVLAEQTGVTVTDLKRVYYDDNFLDDTHGEKKHIITLCYTATYLSGDVQPTQESDPEYEVVQWFSKEQLKTIPLSPPLKRYLKVTGYIS